MKKLGVTVSCKRWKLLCLYICACTLFVCMLVWVSLTNREMLLLGDALKAEAVKEFSFTNNNEDLVLIMERINFTWFVMNY